MARPEHPHSLPHTDLFWPSTLRTQFLITGSSDGFIEVWDASTGKLRTDLPYQAEEAFMMHDAAVLALAVSTDSELLASGAADGSLKVWKLRSGACVRRYAAAHGGGVTSAVFSRDGSHVLSASFDATARVHGLKSGKMLKELRGHASFVNAAAYTPDGACIITAGADGTLRTWDARTGEATAVLRPPAAAGAPAASLPPLLAALPLPGGEGVLVCVHGPCLFLMSLSGALLRALPHGRTPTPPGAPASRDFIAAVLSPRGEWAYGLCEDGVLCCFSLSAPASSSTTKAAPTALIPAHDGTAGAVGLAHHPHRNCVATFATEGLLKLWKP
jgi:WD40 repeat-containing protein SMU1